MCQGSSLFLPFPTTRESNILNLVSHLYYISHQPQPTVPGPYASCSALTRHLDLLYAKSCFAFADSLSVTFLFIPSCSLTVACFDFTLPHPCPVCFFLGGLFTMSKFLSQGFVSFGVFLRGEMFCSKAQNTYENKMVLAVQDCGPHKVIKTAF